jgi:RNA polymerase sigma factor (sigma-70 family)
MRILAENYDLDLNELGDGTLVVLAKECGYQRAETALLQRYYDWSHNLIRQLSRRRGLSAADTEDAGQDAVFGILKAIARYDTQQLARPNGCSFGAFLRRVLTDRFKDFLKHVWRVQNRYRHLVHTDEDGYGKADGVALCKDEQDNPAQAVAQEEWERRARNLVAQLGDRDRELIDILIAGGSLRTAAERLGLSYDQAKRHWRRLRAELARRLPDPDA